MVLLPNITHVDVPYFCSLCCAAEHAIEYERQSGRFWCDKHNRWSAGDGNCRDCFAEQHANKKGSCIRTVPDEAEGKEVQHGS